MMLNKQLNGNRLQNKVSYEKMMENYFVSRYNQLLGIIPSDPGVLQKLGEMFDSMGDKQQAYQYYSDVNIFQNSDLKIFPYVLMPLTYFVFIVL